MAQIDHRLGTPDQLHMYYNPLARSGLCTVLLDNSQQQTFLYEGNDGLQGRRGMLWNGWVQTDLQDRLSVMYHLDIRTPQGILYMLHYPLSCKIPQHMLWVLTQGSHTENLLGRWYIVFVLYCYYRNQIHKALVVVLYLGNKIQQDIPNKTKLKKKEIS